MDLYHTYRRFYYLVLCYYYPTIPSLQVIPRLDVDRTGPADNKPADYSSLTFCFFLFSL